MEFADKTLACKNCGTNFVFTAGEQAFYKEKGLMNEPGRCPACRGARRQAQAGGGERGARQMYPVTCASCGQETQVPFLPRLGKPVYCSECFSNMRQPR